MPLSLLSRVNSRQSGLLEFGWISANMLAFVAPGWHHPNMPKKAGAVIRKKWPVVAIVKKHGNTRYRVDGRPQEGRKFFAAKGEALAHAEELDRLRQQGGTLSLSLAPQFRHEAIEAASILERWNKSLVEAARHYAAFLEQENAKATALTVTDAIHHYLSSKRLEVERGELSPLTVSELASKLRHVSGAFGDWKLPDVTQQSVRKFLDSLPHHARGRANIRTKFSQFLNHCRREGWITANPLDLVKIRVGNDKEPDTLSAAECDRLLRTAEGEFSDLVPFVAVGLFAGLRPGELAALSWKQVHLQTGQIEVLAATSKTRQKRFVPIDSPLDKWLLAYRRQSGPVMPSLFARKWRALREKAELLPLSGDRVWMDILRHTHATFWLAKYQNRAELAERLGNSADVIRKHYRRAVQKTEAEAFWTIEPSGGEKIVAFA